MSTIVTRSGKGSPLTNAEVDSNFENLNTDKAELSGAVFTGAITTNSTIDGRDVATDGTKLDGIEASATADQTGAQIKTAYEAQTNAFTDAQFTKLGGIEASATADQTAAEIRALVESATDSNVFTDADHTKLNGVEASADVTDTANVTAAGALMDSELTAIASVKALNQGVATGDSPTFAAVTANGGVVVDNFTLDGTSLTLSTGNMQLFTSGSNHDILLKGNDGGSVITALALDMSLAGKATFSAGATFGGRTTSANATVGSGTATTHVDLTVNGASTSNYGPMIEFQSAGTAFGKISSYGRIQGGTSTDMFVTTASTNSLVLGTNNTERMRVLSTGIDVTGLVAADSLTVDNFTLDGTTLALSSGNMALDSAGHILLDANSGEIAFQDSGTTFLEIANSSSNAIIRPTVQDKDILFNGNDGGAAITALQLNMSDAGEAIFNAGGTFGGKLTVSDGGNATVAAIRFNAGLGISSPSTDQMNFITADNTRMVIDSAGRFIVGNTSAFDSSSFCVDQSGLGQFRRDGTPLIVRRDGSVGGLIDLEDDGTSVGQIGTEGGDSTYIQGGTTGGSGLHFHGTSSDITPLRNGGRIDNAIDLGSTANRFRDLQLSGGVFLGGTGAANKLDDYEEGTWTPLTSLGGWTVNAGTYTKVGNMVTCRFKVTATATIAANDFTGLPFVPASDSAGICGYQNSQSGVVFGILVQSSNVWNFRVGPTQKGVANNAIVSGMFTYHTTA